MCIVKEFSAAKSGAASWDAPAASLPMALSLPFITMININSCSNTSPSLVNLVILTLNYGLGHMTSQLAAPESPFRESLAGCTCPLIEVCHIGAGFLV